MEAAQDAFVAVAEDGAEIVDYLDEPSVKFQTALIAYGEFEQQSIVDQRGILQGQAEENRRIEEDRKAREVEEAKRSEASRLEAEKEELFGAAAAEFSSGVDAFCRKNDSIRGVVAEASDADKREALRKLEIDFENLRGKLVALGGMNRPDDFQEYSRKFVQDVETPYIATQKWFLLQLKDSQTTPYRCLSPQCHLCQVCLLLTQRKKQLHYLLSKGICLHLPLHLLCTLAGEVVGTYLLLSTSRSFK